MHDRKYPYRVQFIPAIRQFRIQCLSRDPEKATQTVYIPDCHVQIWSMLDDDGGAK